MQWGRKNYVVQPFIQVLSKGLTGHFNGVDHFLHLQSFLGLSTLLPVEITVDTAEKPYAMRTG